MLPRVWQYAPLLVYLFLVVYTPPVGPVPSLAKYAILVLLPLVGTIYLMAHRWIPFELLQQRVGSLTVFVYISVLGSLLVAAVALSNSESTSSILETRLLQNNTTLLMAINAVVAALLVRRRGLRSREALELLLILGSVQGLIALAGLFLPAVKSVSNSLYRAAGGSNEFVVASRIYGFSTDFTYGTQIYHGTLAGIAVALLIAGRGRAWYVGSVVLLLATTALNGRTGLLVFLVIFASSLLIRLIRNGQLAQAVVVTGTATLIGWGALSWLAKRAPTTYTFIASFVEETRLLIVEGELRGNYKILADGLSRIPSGTELILGTGEYVYETAGFRTDVGITIDLFAGGLLYVLFVYGAFLISILDSPKDFRIEKWSLLVMWAFANVKGEFFRSSILLFLVFYLLVNWRMEPTVGSGPRSSNVQRGKRSIEKLPQRGTSDTDDGRRQRRTYPELDGASGSKEWLGSSRL